MKTVAIVTIAAQLQRKIVAARLAGFAFFGVFVLGLFLPKGSWTQALMMIPFIGVAASSLYINAKAVCPKCKARLRQERFGLGLAKNMRACPGCGLDLGAAAPDQTPKG